MSDVQPLRHRGTFAEGESDPADHPEETHVGTFAEGESDPADHPEETHVGTFAEGESDPADHPEDAHVGIFAEGDEALAHDANGPRRTPTVGSPASSLTSTQDSGESDMSVLLCYDGSASAQRALSVAASSLDGAPVVLLNIWNPPQRVLADGFGVSGDDMGPGYAQLEGLAQERAAEILAEGEAKAQRLSFLVTSRQEANRASTWKTILDVADEVDATLIVAGTHGSTAVQSRLRGSVSNALVHHTHRPGLLGAHPRPDGRFGDR